MKDENTEELVGRRLKAYEKIIENRRYQISIIYGLEASKRYNFLPKEKNFFLMYGHLPTNSSADSRYEAEMLQKEIDAHHAEFWNFCDNQYPVQRDAYFSRIETNRKNAESWPEYQKQQKDRDQLAAYLKAQAAQNS